MKTLENVYCVPKQNEWSLKLKKYQNPFNGNDICGKGSFNRKNRTEIPVQHFIDLLEDKMSPWRLLEIGFIAMPYGYEFGSILVICPDPVCKIRVEIDTESNGTISTNCQTFTDLLTLIRLLQ